MSLRRLFAELSIDNDELVIVDIAQNKKVKLADILPQGSLKCILKDAPTSELIEATKSNRINATLLDRGIAGSDVEAVAFLNEMSTNNGVNKFVRAIKERDILPSSTKKIKLTIDGLYSAWNLMSKPREDGEVALAAAPNRELKEVKLSKLVKGMTRDIPQPFLLIRADQKADETALCNKVNKGIEVCVKGVLKEILDVMESNNVDIKNGRITQGLGSRLTIQCLANGLASTSATVDQDLFPIIFAETVDAYCAFHNSYHQGFGNEDLAAFDAVFHVYNQYKVTYFQAKKNNSNYHIDYIGLKSVSV